MNITDAFLSVTSMAYYIAVLTSAIKGETWIRNLPLWKEIMAFCIYGAVIACNLALDHSPIWAIISANYACAAILSYRGYVDWGGTVQNLFMVGWDLLIAIACLLKL